MKGNDFVRWVLKSPLHGLMGSTLLVTVTGRRSGRELTVPVNYYAEGDTLWIMSTRARTWWRNIRPEGCVRVRLRGRERTGTASIVTDESGIAAQVLEYLRHLPMAAGALGVRMQNGVANLDDAARLAKDRLFVKICLSGGAA